MTRKPKAKAITTTQQNITDEGSVLDLSGIDNTLTDRAKRFVFFFTYPGTDCFQSKIRAAIRAGYAKKNAVSSGYKLCQNPVIKKEIERLSGMYASETLDSAYRRYINTLETRAFYDLSDFVSGATFKPIEEIDPEKRLCLDQVVLNTKGEILGYTFGNRKSAMSEIKNIYEKIHNLDIDDGEDDELTMEIIKERLTVKMVARKETDEISRIAGLKDEDGVHRVQEL
jgi:hypothetical protein